MSKPPSLQFYPGDRLRELMPIMGDSEALGAWVKAWMYLWGSGPCSPEVLAQVAGKGWERVGFLFTLKDGLLQLDWMEEKRAETVAFRTKQAQNGRRGGRPKATSTKAKNPSLSSGITQTKAKKSPRVEGEGEIEGGVEGVVDSEVHEPIVELWPTFNDWWEAYGRKVDRAKCEAKWKRMTQADRERAIRHTEAYVKATPDVTYRRHPSTYLNNENWNDEDLTVVRQQPARQGHQHLTFEERVRAATEFATRHLREPDAGTGH